MAKQPNHEADIVNANKGVPGQNKAHAQNQGNRGRQMDPKQQGGKPAAGKPGARK